MTLPSWGWVGVLSRGWWGDGCPVQGGGCPVQRGGHPVQRGGDVHAPTRDHVTYPMMHLVSPPSGVEQTDACENISFGHFATRAVTKKTFLK